MLRKPRSLFLFWCIVVSSVMIICFFQTRPKPVSATSFTGVAMTMPYTILVGETLSETKEKQLSGILENLFDEVNRHYNRWNSDSEISCVNRMPANQPIHLSAELMRLFELSDKAFKITEGRFDPTVAPLLEAWKEALQKGEKLSKKELSMLLSSVGWQHVILENRVLVKKRDAMQFSFDGIVKGYAIDLLIDRLQSANFHDVYVEWGGDIRVIGKHPRGRDWYVGLSLSNKEEWKRLALQNSAIAGSGDAVNFWEYLSKKSSKRPTLYSHIVDCKKGTLMKRKKGSILATYAKAPSCWLADAIATAAMTFSDQESLKEWSERIWLKNKEIHLWGITLEEK